MTIQEAQQLRGVISQMEGVLAHLKLVLSANEPRLEEEARRCARCGGDDFSEAGETMVCATRGCNANYQGGHLVE